MKKIRKKKRRKEEKNEIFVEVFHQPQKIETKKKDRKEEEDEAAMATAIRALLHAPSHPLLSCSSPKLARTLRAPTFRSVSLLSSRCQVAAVKSASYSVKEEGKPDTLEYRVFFFDSEGKKVLYMSYTSGFFFISPQIQIMLCQFLVDMFFAVLNAAFCVLFPIQIYNLHYRNGDENMLFMFFGAFFLHIDLGSVFGNLSLEILEWSELDHIILRLPFKWIGFWNILRNLRLEMDLNDVLGHFYTFVCLLVYEDNIRNFVYCLVSCVFLLILYNFLDQFGKFQHRSGLYKTLS